VSPPLPPPLPAAFFDRSVHQVAPQLIGCVLLVDGVGGPIVECEAYDRTDPASHTFRGQTPRNAAMFGPRAHAYVYRSYGVHWLINLVCGTAQGAGEAALIRALEPVYGLEVMRARRRVGDDRLLCAGPGRLSEALGIGPDLNAAAIGGGRLELREPLSKRTVVTGPRVGISRGVERPWRYAAADCPYVSRPYPWRRRVRAA
jgi:DNA-3-methyladenine glycosylase